MLFGELASPRPRIIVKPRGVVAPRYMERGNIYTHPPPYTRDLSLSLGSGFSPRMTCKKHEANIKEHKKDGNDLMRCVI